MAQAKKGPRRKRRSPLEMVQDAIAGMSPKTLTALARNLVEQEAETAFYFAAKLEEATKQSFEPAQNEAGQVARVIPTDPNKRFRVTPVPEPTVTELKTDEEIVTELARPEKKKRPPTGGKVEGPPPFDRNLDGPETVVPKPEGNAEKPWQSFSDVGREPKED